MGTIRINLLGGFSIEHEGRALPPIPSAKGRSLFAFLVTHRDRRHTRDLLAGTFWPDQPEAAARRRLSQALWQIQTVLAEAGPEPRLIDSTPSDVAFSAYSAAYWVDVDAFDTHLTEATRHAGLAPSAEAAELEAAVQLYRGEFLAGFYDDWSFGERERFRARYLSALERLVAVHKGRADYEMALSFAQRLVLHEPLREEAHREVMRLCFLLGRSNEALSQFERCAAVLAVELGTHPTAETRELRAQIAQLRDKGERPLAPTNRSPLLDRSRPVPLVGRDEERVALLRTLDDAVLERGGAVFVEGPSGIGKTRLLRELAEDAQWRGLGVVWVECREEEMLHPLQGARLALEASLTRLRAEQLRVLLHEQTLTEVARLVPGLRSWLPDLPEPRESTPAPSPDPVRHAVRATLAALAELNPMVLFVDDAQWLDAPSAAVLAEMAPELSSRGLLLCLGYRDDEARSRAPLWDYLVRIDAAANAEKLALRELDFQLATRLIEESLGVAAVQAEIAESLYVEAGGNPLFILETLRAWHEQGRGQLADDSASSSLPESSFPVVGGVAEVIDRRLVDLSDQSRVVLRAAAVLGNIADPLLLASIVGMPRLAVLRAIEELIHRGALVESEDGYHFSHHQIRRVALDAMPAKRRRDLHAKVARAIERRDPGRVEELAYHYTTAGLAPEALRFSIGAGRRARSLGAFDTAADHFENAAGWGLPDGRFQLLSEWEDALDVLGRRANQHRLLGELDSLADGAQQRADILRRRSRLADHEGDHPEAIGLAMAAVAELPVDAGPIGRGLAEQNMGLVLSHAGRPGEAVAHLEAAVAALQQIPRLGPAALSDLGNVLYDAQQYERAAAVLGAARSRYEQSGDPYGLAETCGRLAMVAMEQGDGERAVALYSRALDLSRDVAYRRGEAVNLANLGNALYFQGEVVEALARYDEAAFVFGEIGDRRGQALVSANAASVRHVVLGDATVESDIRESLDYFVEDGHGWGQAFCREHLAKIAWRKGDLERARAEVASGLSQLAEGPQLWVEVHLRRLAAEIELESGRLDEAEEQIEVADGLCRQLGLNDVLPTILSIRSSVALARGDIEAALGLSREATAKLDRRAEQPYMVWFRRYLAAEAAAEHDVARDAVMRSLGLLNDLLATLDGADLMRAESVPEHQLVLEAGRRWFPAVNVVPLPRVDAPRGRAPGSDDLVTVRLTVSHPSDVDLPPGPERRRRRLRRLLEEAEAQGASARVEDLALALDVSGTTIRRDMAALRKRGHRVRTRGSR